MLVRTGYDRSVRHNDTGERQHDSSDHETNKNKWCLRPALGPDCEAQADEGGDVNNSVERNIEPGTQPGFEKLHPGDFPITAVKHGGEL